MATTATADLEAVFVPPAGLAQGDLLFWRMSAHEALGRLPEYHVELLRDRTKERITASQVLGKAAAVKLRLETDTYRYFHCLVTRFRRGGITGRYDIYHVEMRPWLWYLTLGADCRIFQDKTAVEIIKLVFEDYGASVQFEDLLDGSFRQRPFTVQYRESDFDFVSRLMEEEGIYYYFKHEASKHTMVLCNGPGGHTPIKGDELNWVSSVSGNQLREDVITEWDLVHSIRSLKYTHTDYAAEAPATDLKSEAARTASYGEIGDLEVFDYPGGYDDVAMKDGSTSGKTTEGGRLAQLRVDAMESQHEIAEGVTPSRDLGVGLTFSLVGHDDDDNDYLVAMAEYTMQYGGYEADRGEGALEYVCRFEAVPKTVSFQPHAVTPRPVIAGPQTATVVGPSGDEIHTDKFGRVKVKFHWDRVGQKNETASCFVRVAFPWASKQFGFVSLPRVGDEVVVEFLEGNPDRPLITGAVYNGTNLPPYTLPAQATVSGVRTQSSTGGSTSTFNELRFDDKKGSEYVWFQAEKDYNHWVKNDAKVTIKGMRKQLVEKDDQLKVNGKLDGEIVKEVTLKVGTDVNAGVGGDLIMKIGGATGLTIEGTTKLKSAGGISITGDAALDVTAASGVKINSDAALHLKAAAGVMIDGGPQLAIKAGAGFIVLDASGVSIVGPMVKINSGGSATPAQKALKATVPAAKEPPAPPDHTDPLASG